MIIKLAAISGLLAVLLGAFGAHGLKTKLPTDMLAIYHTAVQYQFYHTMALLLVGLLMIHWPSSTALLVSACCFIVGIIIFSGTLYVLSITGIRWLGAITPIGGVGFIVGWISLFYAAMKVS